MILQRLVEHYDRVAIDPAEASRLPRRGYSLQKVSFCVVLNRDGSLQQVESLLDAGRTRAIPRQVLVPRESERTSGIKAGFLSDTAEYLLGFPTDAKRASDARYLARVVAKFNAFREGHLALEGQIDSGGFRCVCDFLRQWDPAHARARAPELGDLASHFGVFRIAGTQEYVHDDPGVRSYWAQRQTRPNKGAVEGTCLVTGAHTVLARLHEPKIKGVSGAQSSGALLVSFNEDAYTSYGRDQSYNAPVGEEAAFKYAVALNWLLGEQNRRIQLGDATVVFWAERPTAVESFVSDLLGGPTPSDAGLDAEDARRREQVRLFLSQVRSGLGAADGSMLESEDERRARFWILALSPNASRLSVRFWLETSAGELMSRLGQHLRDVELAGRRDHDAPLSIRRLVQATGRADLVNGMVKSYDADSISPLLAASAARAVLFGTAYPQSLLTAMLGRLRADGAVTHERIAAVKACIVRNARLQGRPREVSVSLDPQRSDAAYVTGRVFALLEKIQQDSADGELNATIKDRFFSSASATPGVVFPRLLRLSQHHLSKLDAGKRIWHERQLQEAIGKLDGFAAHLGIEDQGLFAIGYYHQRQHFFRKKDEREDTGDDA